MMEFMQRAEQHAAVAAVLRHQAEAPQLEVLQAFDVCDGQRDRFAGEALFRHPQ